MRLRWWFGLAPMSTIALAGQPSGAELQPLDDGWVWTFENPAGDVAILEVTGPRSVRGRDTVGTSLTIDGGRIVDEFWSTNSEDELVLHGIIRPNGTEVSYEPPIVVIGNVPAGEPVCTTFDAYDGLDLGGPVRDSGIELCHAMDGVESYEVPAGEFQAYPQFVVPRFSGVRWRVPGLGPISLPIGPEPPYELVSWTDPTPTQRQSWSEVKARFAVD